MWERVYWHLFGTNVRMIRTIVLIVLALHVLYFVVLPILLTRRKLRGQGLRRYLGFVVATPSLLGDSSRAWARHELMRLSQNEGLHDRAVEQGLAVVRHPKLPGSMVAEVRGRLADSLEALGRHDEAAEQRRLAEGDLDAHKGKREADWYINRARQLEARRDYEGACQALRDGLESTATKKAEFRGMLLLQLAIDTFHAGRMEESAGYAIESADLFPDPQRQYLAHRQAGASLGSCGRLDDGETHRLRAVELAQALDDKSLVDALGDLAEMSRKRGRLPEALAAVERAESTVRPARHTEMIRYEIFRSWGRFEEALAASRRAAKLDPLPIPRQEQFIQGVLAFGRAGLNMELGRLDEAESELRAARAAIAGDPKITLWIDASAARLAALRGDREAADRAIADAEGRLAGYAADRNTSSGVLGNLGRACLALAEYDRALGFWTRYVETKLNPVDLPTAYYHLAEAQRGLGDNEAARADYREAIATGLDTHYVRLAQSRLRTLPI